MRSNIIDSDGVLVYRGNEVDAKFKTLLAVSGNQRLDTTANLEEFSRPKWNGSAWVEGRTASQIWAEDMGQFQMSRAFENHITASHDGGAGNAYDQAIYDSKVLRRSQRT